MGVRTSVYLSDGLHAAVKASGLPLAELVRRGLDARVPEVESARLAAEAVRDDVESVVSEAVKRALRDVQGGSW